MAPSTVCRVLFGAALPSVAVLLAGCGGGGGSDTPAPTAPPTPPPTPVPTSAAPTPAPTLPPTDAGMNGVCAWKVADAAVPTIQIQEAQCDDKNNQLKMTSVTMITQTMAFKGEDTCSIIIANYMQSKCEGAAGKATDVKSTPTDGSCTITITTDAGITQTELASTHCDEAAKTYVNHQTIKVPNLQPYGQEKQCKIDIPRWIAGMESAHPGSCAPATLPPDVADALSAARQLV